MAHPAANLEASIYMRTGRPLVNLTDPDIVDVRLGGRVRFLSELSRSVLDPGCHHSERCTSLVPSVADIKRTEIREQLAKIDSGLL